MRKIQIKENYEYWYFENQREFFSELDALLEDGYKITDSIHLCVEVSKGDTAILLSYVEVQLVDENIKDTLRAMDLDPKLVKPDYHQCILNTIASILKNLGQDSLYTEDQRMTKILNEKNYKNIIIMLLDGLGENILEHNTEEHCFLKQYHAYTNVAIYPSTTAASTTATKNGLSPITTGWTGWENYFREVDRNLTLFHGKNYVTDEPTGFDTYKALPYQLFYQELEVIEPDFSNPDRKFKDVLDRSLDQLSKGKGIQYVYHQDPDHTMHEFGAYSEEACLSLKEINRELEEYVKKLPSDTLLIISADHGHTNVTPIDLYSCKTIQKMLNRRPSNDSRCITFSVKEEYKDVFMTTFQTLFGYAYDIYPTQELIDQEFFGQKQDIPSPRVKDFLADFVAIGTKNYYFNYKGEDNMVFKSHHAGITADEMLVPVIIFRK